MGRQLKSGGGGKLSRGSAASKASACSGVPTCDPWPSEVQYLTSLVWDTSIIRDAKDVYRKYKVSGSRPIEGSPAAAKKTVRWQRITDPAHPARGEFGLFATRNFGRGDHLIDYLGYVSLAGTEVRPGNPVSGTLQLRP